MMKNGKLPSAGGRPKGTTLANGRCKVSKPTAERAELLSLWRAEVSKQFKTLVQMHIKLVKELLKKEVIWLKMLVKVL